MRILGIDPGTYLMGLAVLEENNRGEISLIASGVLDLRKEERKKVDKIIFQSVAQAIKDYSPDAMAIEDQFIGVNPRAGLTIAKAKNAAILAAQMANLPYQEYSPSQVKLAATGQGNATKEAVAVMVCSLLKIQSPKHFDETDAMAVALCGLNRRMLRS